MMKGQTEGGSKGETEEEVKREKGGLTREEGVEEVREDGCFSSMSGWKACLRTEATCRRMRRGREEWRNGDSEPAMAAVMGVGLHLRRGVLTSDMES